VRAVDGGTIWDHAFMNVSAHGAITTPLINLPHWCLVVDVIDTCLSGVVLLERTSAVNFMLLANVYRCSKVHELVDVRAAAGNRSKFLNQLGLEERFDVVPRPLEAPEGDVILCDQSRIIVKQEPHVNLNRDSNRTPIEAAKAAERNHGRVYGQLRDGGISWDS